MAKDKFTDMFRAQLHAVVLVPEAKARMEQAQQLPVLHNDDLSTSDAPPPPLSIERTTGMDTPAHSASQPLSQPVTQPHNRPLSWPVTQPDSSPLSQPLGQMGGHSASPQDRHSASHSASQSKDQSISHSVDHTISQSLVSDRLTNLQRKVLQHLLDTRPYITTFGHIGQATKMPEATARTVLRRLAALDFITFSRARDGQIQGVSVKFNDGLCKQFLQGHSLSHTLNQPADHSLSQSISQPLSQLATRPDLSLDREIKKNLSIRCEQAERLITLTEDQVRFYWPNLAKVGFGADQIRQAVESVEALGKPLDKFQTGLDHVEWELGQNGGKLFGKDGEEIRKPDGYVFNALARTGYYRRPDGYVSPETQALLDEEQEALAQKAVREKTEATQFEVWKDGLSSEEKARFLEGRKGPEEQWLKNKWRQSLKIISA